MKSIESETGIIPVIFRNIFKSHVGLETTLKSQFLDLTADVFNVSSAYFGPPCP